MFDDWIDSRRLIGPSLFSDSVGALLEVSGTGPEFEHRIARWRQHASFFMRELGWKPDAISVHPYPGGAMLVIGAPADVLYTATEVSEAAWSLAHEESDDDIQQRLDTLTRARDEEADPAGLALYEHARSEGFSAFLDENGLSIGTGCRSRHWPPGDAPSPQQVNWADIGDVPVVLITGTNGKTTTSRILAAILQQSGLTPGLTSTDAIHIGGEVIEKGDFSGPAGARTVLRDRRTRAAVLETARGGLLRRGLAVDRADVAVVTNIAADHLGDGGIETLEDLARVKFLICRAVTGGGTAILNADDRHCLERADNLEARIGWFSVEADRPRVAGEMVWADETTLYRLVDGVPEPIIDLAGVPITLNGTARHNVANVAAATAAAFALGVGKELVAEALAGFGRSPDDNPGRGMLLELGAVRALLDFGHNPDGISAILQTAHRLVEGEVSVVFGQAGDRTDEAIRDLTRAIHAGGASRFVIKEMAEYRRGRAPGEVPRIIHDELLRLGVARTAIHHADSDEAAAEEALRRAAPGDLLVLFIHSDREQVITRLNALANQMEY